MNFKQQVPLLLREIQNKICGALENVDGNARFIKDIWTRTDLKGLPGGGGETRVLSEGAVFEKAGVNFSEVNGFLPEDFSAKLGCAREETPFFACGVSLVIHPRSPMIPTTHANWRYLEAGPFKWFGGGSDLTPYYLFEEDAKHFHSVLRQVCNEHDPTYYSRFKKWCDEYFFLPHRGESRGIGGIFFDYIGKDDGADLQKICAFVNDLGLAFNDQYIPIVKKRKGLPYSEEQRNFQLLRRGRYVEFNLLYDRGTQFGLQTGGRTESILMSLPSPVRWEYNYSPQAGTPEATLIEVLKTPREWV